MKIVYQLCRALSLGVLLGFLGGGLRLLRRPAYSEKQIAAAQRMKSIFAGILKYFTFLFLVLGLVWCSTIWRWVSLIQPCRNTPPTCRSSSSRR